jgi:mRNA interferase RelE/StbE
LAWQIELHPQAEKELSKLDRKDARRLVRFLRERVAQLADPRSIGEALRGPDIGRFWKYRVGKYRIVCDIQDLRRTILVVRIGHRREIYR